MRRKSDAGLAGIEYHGIAGVSRDCRDAVERLLQCRYPVVRARIITFEHTHALLLTNDVGDQIVIKTGFSSGYGGEGPTAFSRTLQLLDSYGCEIDECDVSQAVLERLELSALTNADLDMITASRPILPHRWHDYVLQHHFNAWQEGTLWREFRPVMPYAIIDSRIIDLALSFWNDPDDKLMKGYRRLEDCVRDRTGLSDHGQKLFSAAFLGDQPLLSWEDIDKSEKSGRATLFTATYGAHRNPRSHRELKSDLDGQLAEFLLLNHLFRLEKESVKLEGGEESGADKP